MLKFFGGERDLHFIVRCRFWGWVLGKGIVLKWVDGGIRCQYGWGGFVVCQACVLYVSKPS